MSLYSKKRIISTLDRFFLIKERIISSSDRVGLFANQCSYSFSYKQYIFELMDIKRVFLLEHGFFSELQDQISIHNMEFFQKFSGEWVHLYGKTFESLFPEKENLWDLDWIIIDLQDIGSRYYTFLTSVYYLFFVVMQEKLPIRFIILDRPNPLIEDYSHRKCEGTPLQKQYESFVGIEGVLHQHSFTSAELLFYYWNRLEKNFSLQEQEFWFVPFFDTIPIIRLYPSRKFIDDIENAKQLDSYSLFFDIYPSPNMPTIKTAKVYTGQCLLEGTNLSEGRGTTKPFEIFGAPYIDIDIWNYISRMKEFDSLGVLLRKTRFIPNFSQYAGEECNGWQIHIISKQYHSLLTSLWIIKQIKTLTKDFDWYRGVYEFKKDYLAIEYLLGDEFLFRFLNSNSISLDDVYQYLEKHQNLWLSRVKNFYFYS